ncbi:MAG: DMT family transporter, partial [Rhodovibrionaceae bacterium]
ERLGLLLGMAGVVCFGLTLPATRLALQGFDPWFIALGRAALAGLISAALLLLWRSPLPARRLWPSLALVALGVIFGFPLLSTWAMQYVPAGHGGVVLAILPLATAAAGALRTGERPSSGFWVFALLGSACVAVFSLYQGGGGIVPADLALLGGVVLAALGYAEGARVARAIGAPETICWALVLALPVTLPAGLWLLAANGLPAATAPWLGFFYVSLFSQLLGFFAWYRGLDLGGVAKVAQLQLLMPFVTLAGAALLLGETIEPATLGFAVAVCAIVGLGRRMPVRRAAA